MMSSEAIWFETCVDCRAEFMATSTTQCCSVVGEAQTLGSIDIGLPGVAGIRESRRKGPSGNARRGYVRSRGRCLPRGVCHPCVFETTPEHQENKVHPGEHQDSPGPKMSNPRRSHATLQPADSQHAKDQPDAAASAVMRSRSAVSVATLQPQTQFDWDAEWENGGAFGYWIPQDSQECHNSFVPPWRIAARMVVLLILWGSQAHIGTQTAEESRRAFQNTENWYNETDPNDWQVLMKAFGATIYLQRHAPNATPCFFLDVSVAGAQRFTNGARALVIPYTCSTWRQSMAVKLDAKIMPTKLRDALVNGPWLCEGVVADNKLSPHQLQGVTLRFAGCRLLGGMMPQQPDFDQMQLTDLEELTPYFKRYGITKTAPNAFGKHKKKDIKTLRDEFKALRKADVEEAWQRYQEAKTKAQPVKPASIEGEDASPGAHVYPKKANGLYDFERMNKHQLRSLVTPFKDHGARRVAKKNAMLDQFRSFSDEIVQKVMQQQAQDHFGTKKESELQEAMTSRRSSSHTDPRCHVDGEQSRSIVALSQVDVGAISASATELFDKVDDDMNFKAHCSKKRKRGVSFVDDAPTTSANAASTHIVKLAKHAQSKAKPEEQLVKPASIEDEDAFMKSFSKATGYGVPEDPSSQGARTSQELLSKVRPRLP